LLSGLLRCGRCGRRLFVAYGGNGGRVPRYGCHGGRVNRGSAACLSVGSLRVDHAVVEQVLAAIQPSGIHAALAAEAEVDREQAQVRRNYSRNFRFWFRGSHQVMKALLFCPTR
jgi:hypothetical protein